MALCLQTPPSGLSSTRRSGSNTSHIRPPSVTVFAVNKASSKQQQKGSVISLPTTFSPDQIIPSSFGLDMTVLELERLFKEARGNSHLLPQLSGPSHPSPIPSFSGRPPVRVAYQGVPGSYCQEAAIKAFSSICTALPCNHMEDAFQALEDKTAHRAIIPIENSIDGPIYRNFDLLLRHQGVRIVRELILPVNHCLLAVPGASTSSLKRIVSHPQALSHCKSKLKSLPHLEIEEVPNAADAARYVSENHIADTAVIGSKIAGREFGLQILEQNFQDGNGNGNFNRFLQLGLEPFPEPQGTEKSRAWKTSIAFSLENGASDLFRALWLFESRNITVTRVEHRPNRLNPVRVVKEETGDVRYMDYIFILDLEGNLWDSSLRKRVAFIPLPSKQGIGMDCAAVGNGLRVKLWEDTWLGTRPLKEVFLSQPRIFRLRNAFNGYVRRCVGTSL
ncbi:arogenate dehydratase/prephenate dehydratase 1, chloroplastic-like [Magnolia sinica]|uniref:arogenate dehydratase/prephenate dehydratase 1, chloroplastic-like n=1 Tax=Magnolia sinica TaxID=86752 RepID=UPI00265AE788|nr:arogenate dehydratase/prephenate dehydratase 1, chloroplastic-like [Magnolia sinica]